MDWGTRFGLICYVCHSYFFISLQVAKQISLQPLRRSFCYNEITLPTQNHPRKRLITQEWANALHDHIDAQPRGYQADLARQTGCSEGLLHRIKTCAINSSNHLESIAAATGLQLPPLDVDDLQAEMHELSSKLSAKDMRAIIRLMRDLSSD